MLPRCYERSLETRAHAVQTHLRKEPVNAATTMEELDADALKAQGNETFALGKFEEALQFYSRAIDKQNDAIEKAKAYSNRSACLFNLARYEEAAEDGGMCIQLHPTWPKGHFRMGEGT
jgi:tetratricopeptide (TPR) repeat protein